MFVKLNFTVGKDFRHCVQIANAIINDTAINSVAALNTAAAAYNTTVMAGFDFTNSEIIRTVEPTTVKSHYAKTGSSNSDMSWTMEFSVYDASSRKYYVAFDQNTSTATIHVGNTIASGSMTGSQYAMNLDSRVDTNASDSGTPVKLSSVAPAKRLTANIAGQLTDGSSPANRSNIRCFWMYLTNDCLIIALCHNFSSSLGFDARFNTVSNYTINNNFSGPWIFSQYRRYDYHNTDANGVIPMMFSNISKSIAKGNGFGLGSGPTPDWARIENVNQSTDPTSMTDTAFRVFNFIDAHPQVGTGFPLVDFPAVNWGSGSRDTSITPLTAKTGLNAASFTTVHHPRLIHTVSQTRYPSSDLRSVGYGMLPLRWRNSYRFNQGGNATDRGGFYIYNGEYFPGDTFLYAGKTYMIWPTFLGFVDRVGIAVPKE